MRTEKISAASWKSMLFIQAVSIYCDDALHTFHVWSILSFCFWALLDIFEIKSILINLHKMDLYLNFSNLPSGPPPPGVVPNFVNPVNSSIVTYVVVSILIPLMLLAVLLRLYSNFCVSRSFAKSDCKFLLLKVLDWSLTSARCLYSSCGKHPKLL